MIWIGGSRVPVLVKENKGMFEILYEKMISRRFGFSKKKEVKIEKMYIPP